MLEGWKEKITLPFVNTTAGVAVGVRVTEVKEGAMMFGLELKVCVSSAVPLEAF